MSENSGPHEFREAYKNAARDHMLQAMESGPVSTADLIRIGRKFPGVTTGMISTMAKHGDIERPEYGFWKLASPFDDPADVPPQTVGEVEIIGPQTTRVGDQIVHNGAMYVRVDQEEHDQELTDATEGTQ
jgi:hypothetical protein